MNTPEYGAGTHVGRVREQNEDYYYADPAAGIWLIADGMGGHESGEIASSTVGEYIPQALAQGASVREAIVSSHKAIFDAVGEGRGAQGMGTTVVVLKMQDNAYEIAWVGDSRAYLWNGTLQLLTRDHSLVQRLLDAGIIDIQEARQHPQRNRLTNVLGAIEPARLKVDTIQGTLQPGECILLCSDGLSGEVSADQIAAILRTSLSVQDKVQRLIQAALDAGGPDNITVLLIPAPETDLEPTEKLTTRPRRGKPSATKPPAAKSIPWTWLSVIVILGLFLIWLWLSQNP